MFEFPSSRGLKNRRIRTRFEENIEPQEIFLDALAQRQETEHGMQQRKFEVPLSKNSIRVFRIGTLILLLVLFVKIVHLQIFENSMFLALAEENKFIVRALQADRGVIYDSTGKQLVANKPSFDLRFDPRALSSSQSNTAAGIEKVAQILNLDSKDIKRKIDDEKGGEVLIAENLDHEKLILLEAKKEELPGFSITRNAVRVYEESQYFSHLLGYIGKITSEELKTSTNDYSLFDYVGKNGIEKSYEEVLRKNPGKLLVKRDALGRYREKEIVSLPKSGKSLVLWLDADLQKKITQELEKILASTGAKKAVAIALNPQNGGVLGLVSIPQFDNNLFQKGADQKTLREVLQDPQGPLFNRTITGLYPTGSTIKPLIASAVLEEGIIDPNKMIHDQGVIEIPHAYDPDIIYSFHGWRVLGWTNLRKAIAESSNIYFYTVGGGYKDQEGLGPSRIKQYLELFGWGALTGIDLPGEATGSIPSPVWKKEAKGEGWWDGDTYNLSIGQGDILVTPLQVATSFAAIANGGTLYQPRTVKEIVDSSSGTIEKQEPMIIRQDFIDQENLRIVREGMRMAVTGKRSPHASSIMLNSLPVTSAAKTGTAQTPHPDRYHNWVTVFAPYEDPQIVLTIMIENVPELQAAALPAAKNILEWYFTPI